MIYFQEFSIFIHIPRTSGMSLAELVMRHGPMEASPVIALGGAPHRFRRHAQASDVRSSIPEFNQPWFRKFTIMRNPWRMIESMFRHFRDEFERIQSWPQPRPQTFAATMRGILTGIARQTFERFVLTHYRYLQAPFGFWGHWCSASGRDLGCEVFRFESLDSRWHEILQLLRLPPACERPSRNQAVASVPCDWTDRAVDFIRNRCHDDFVRFGYPSTPDERTEG